MVAVPNDISVVEESQVEIQDTELASSPSETEKKPIEQKKASIALIFGPGLNRTVGYSTFLKALKKQNVEVEMVSGTGMGAIVAAHFASGKTPQKLEWLFFKFFNETKGKKPYSNSWKKSLEEVFLKEFKNVKVEDLKIPLVVPVYQKNPPMVKNINKGNLFELLQAQFIFSTKEEGPYTSPLTKEVYNGFWMRKLGAKVVVGMDVLGKKVLFEEEDKSLKELYNKILKNIRSDKGDLDIYFSLPFSEMPLDSEKKLPESLQKTAEYGEWAAKTIKIKRDAIKNDEKVEED
jgi:hypothetical protein